jgi:folate-dependent phosphoribosylglycinamide formyltransferase PurN
MNRGRYGGGRRGELVAVTHRMQKFKFLIVTSADLPEAYFLTSCLATRAQRIALVNVARPARSYLRALARLRRTRGVLYLADLLLARLSDVLMGPIVRRTMPPGSGAFPEVDARLIERIRARHAHIDCADPHAPEVIAFVRGFAPDYILLAGCPILKECFYGLARRAALNRHLGMLPDFRGSDCPRWAFALERPDRAGYSIHVVSERVDAGDVVLRRCVPVHDDPSLPRYLRRLQREASEGFIEVLDCLLHGAPLPREPQNGAGRYYPPAGLVTRLRAHRNYARLLRSASLTLTPKRA